MNLNLMFPSHFYKTYKIINKYLQSQISNFCIIENTKKIMRCMIPFVPHLANECLELLQCSNKYEWPEVKKSDNTLNAKINGKTRDIITIKKFRRKKNYELYN